MENNKWIQIAVVVVVVVGSVYLILQNSNARGVISVYPVQCDDWFPAQMTTAQYIAKYGQASTTVTFSNGKKVTFDEMPTQADIDEVAQKYGWKPEVTFDNQSNQLQRIKDFDHCLQRRALSRISLKIDEKNQQVIKWNIDDGAGVAFYRSADCTIVDKNNWSCDNGGSYPFGINNGIYFESDFTNVIFVSEAQWDSINNGAATPFGTSVPNISE